MWKLNSAVFYITAALTISTPSIANENEIFPGEYDRQVVYLIAQSRHPLESESKSVKQFFEGYIFKNNNLLAREMMTECENYAVSSYNFMILLEAINDREKYLSNTINEIAAEKRKEYETQNEKEFTTSRTAIGTYTNTISVSGRSVDQSPTLGNEKLRQLEDEVTLLTSERRKEIEDIKTRKKFYINQKAAFTDSNEMCIKSIIKNLVNPTSSFEQEDLINSGNAPTKAISEELETLSELFQQELLTEEEFNAAKRRLLGL